MSIEDYEFSDSDVMDVSYVNGRLDEFGFVELNLYTDNLHLQRDDVIALAKHFKLTANDLNTD